MNIIWDEEKNSKLKKERQISFEEIERVILAKKYIKILKHPKHPGQRVFIIPIKGYIHAVPFLLDADNNIILKTAFPSRKFHKIYGRKIDENKT
jgi:uncharacterized DUF497 family protein